MGSECEGIVARGSGVARVEADWTPLTQDLCAASEVPEIRKRVLLFCRSLVPYLPARSFNEEVCETGVWEHRQQERLAQNNNE